MKLLSKNKPIGIWGFGKVGKAIAQYLREQGYTISVMDKRVPTDQEQIYIQEKNIAWYTQEQQETFFSSCEHIFFSPGVNISALCYATHIDKWISELDFFYHAFQKPIIAITGSIGKTSTVSILAELFAHLHIPAAVGGNIGTPTFDLIKQQNNVDFALLEVSSFQLQRCTNFAPWLSVWTNFYPNHLDYHTDEQDYFLAKQTILNHQKNSSFSLIPLQLRGKVPAPAHGNQRSYFTLTRPNDECLQTLQKNESVYYIENNMIVRHANNTPCTVMQLTQALINFSFLDNILLIAAVCDIMKISTQTLHIIAQTVQLPEHRVEHVGSVNSINFYNDSKATTTASTLAAVKKFKHHPLHLFIGGLSKGIDRTQFIAQLKNQVSHIYCFGQEADALYLMCQKNNIPSSHFNNLNDAFSACSTTIKTGDYVLLSPAGSSYDLYENYEERGKHFKKLVCDYMQKSSSV